MDVSTHSTIPVLAYSLGIEHTGLLQQLENLCGKKLHASNVIKFA